LSVRKSRLTSLALMMVRKKRKLLLAIAAIAVLGAGAYACMKLAAKLTPPAFAGGIPATKPDRKPAETAPETTGPEAAFLNKLVDAAIERTTHQVEYDPAYVVIPYPGGDVPDDKGVCSDVVVRAYRKLGIDLQKEVHEDMSRNFKKYPKKWGLKRPDTNIDHRRVYNLMTFFARKGEVLAGADQAGDYKPGDLVCWDIAVNLPHIGIVVDRKSADDERYLIVHNIGAGPRMEEMLFEFKIIGHYRYFGPDGPPGEKKEDAGGK